MLGVAPLVLPACDGSTISAEILQSPPDQLAEPCERPVYLPERSLTQAEVETYWALDRSNLIRCGETKEAITRYYQERDSALLEAGQ